MNAALKKVINKKYQTIRNYTQFRFVTTKEASQAFYQHLTKRTQEDDKKEQKQMGSFQKMVDAQKEVLGRLEAESQYLDK